MAANGNVFVYCLVLHAKPQRIWDARGKVLELFAREDLFIRGKALTCNTDCPPRQLPTRKRSGKVCTAFFALGLVRSQVTSNFEMPVTSYFYEVAGRRPTPLATWSEEKGFIINEGGVTEAFHGKPADGVGDQLGARPNTSS